MFSHNFTKYFLIFSIITFVSADNSLEIHNLNIVDGQGTFDIYMANTDAVGGMQIPFSGISINDAYGGASSDAGWMISTNSFQILGFSLSGTSIPPGDGTLVSVAFSADWAAEDICFDNPTMSSAAGSALDFTIGDCWSDCEFDCAGICDGFTIEDCNGDCGGNAVVDECGICGGDGSSCAGDDYYYEIDIIDTGVTSLHMFMSSITGLENNDEIGIFDLNGITNYNDCSNQIGELLVGASVWDGSQNNIVSIGSADMCAFGGVQVSGSVSGNPVVVRVYRPSVGLEYATEITFGMGTGAFGDVIQSITEVTLGDVIGDCPDNFVEHSDNGDCIPEQFSYNQSTQQAFYFFYNVYEYEGGPNVGSEDWVGAFNPETGICVGARQWDTSQCGGGVCDVPVMGFSPTEPTTEAYMLQGQTPIFKIYDVLENSYYNAIPSEGDWPYSQNQMYIIDSLTGGVSGCTDMDACNYDPNVTMDDGSCFYAEGITDVNIMGTNGYQYMNDSYDCMICYDTCTSSTCSDGPRILPWTQDLDLDGDGNGDVWEEWDITLRDLVFLDRDGYYVTRINLTSYNPDPQGMGECTDNYQTIKDLILELIEQ